MSSLKLNMHVIMSEQKVHKVKNKVTEQDLLSIEHRKTLAKIRFRALIRRVINNRFWLMMPTEEYKGVDNVKLRIEQAVRGRKTSAVALEDKVLLNKPIEDRTYDEKSYLSRKYKGLKCFRLYPQEVRKYLAAVTRFEYFPPGRVIIRENHEPYALYFILNGKVIVTQNEYDEVLCKNKDVEIKILGRGDVFGEISLLHSIRRTSTITTLEHCEFLILQKDDFEYILKGTIQKIWDDIYRAMSAFTYFDTLDEISIQEGCSLGKLLHFQGNETILGDGRGVPNFVYFILKGRTRMIESLKIIVTIDHVGRTRYTLYDPYVEEEEKNTQNEKGVMSKLMRNFTVLKEISEESQIEYMSGTLPERARASTLTATAAAALAAHKTKSKMEQEAAAEARSSLGMRQKDYKIGSEFNVPEAFKYRKKPRPLPLVPMPKKSPTPIKTTRTSDGSVRSCKSSRLLLPPIEDDPYARESVIYTTRKDGVTPASVKNMRTYFMKVCDFKGGSTFGLGENMRDRRIVALTKVTCLILPQTWLMKRNSANIWTRIKHYLNKKIPTKMQLFEEFVNQRRWEEYRQQIVSDIYKRRQRVEHFTLIHDVPYSIRLEEMTDIAYI